MKKRIVCFLAAVLLLWTVSMPAAAAVEETKPCSLELEYSQDGTAFAGQNIRIFRVARIHEDGKVALCDPFDRLPVSIEGISSQKEWRDIANTLASYAAAEQLKPYADGKTDETGTAKFSGLETGVYLVEGVAVKTDSGTYRFENFCIFLPTPQENGTYQYDMKAKPKCDYTPDPDQPAQVKYQVVKLWKDGSDSKKRPASVKIEILKNGKVQETVTLSAANQWTHSWTAPENQDRWSVVEKDVPEGYSVVISGTSTSFTVTNTAKTPPDNPPQTGDTFALRPWLMAMTLSGMVMVALGIWAQRKRG